MDFHVCGFHDDFIFITDTYKPDGQFLRCFQVPDAIPESDDPVELICAAKNK